MAANALSTTPEVIATGSGDNDGAAEYEVCNIDGTIAVYIDKFESGDATSLAALDATNGIPIAAGASRKVRVPNGVDLGAVAASGTPSIVLWTVGRLHS